MNDDIGYNGFNVSLFYLAPIHYEDIEDPNVVITLKSITKKNAVTKEKRLAEFLNLLTKKAFDVSNYYILMCWIQLYPRLALDASKTVRHLAHQIQASYMESYGAKEFSPYLKSSLPTWLQGLYDDKSIAVSIRSNLLQNFSNDETKVNSKIWMVFHEQIVNYCYHVLVQQSANTMSDERLDSEDELNLKYSRAIVSAILMLSKMLELVNSKESFLREAAQECIEKILTLEKVWDHLASFSNNKSFNLALFKALVALIAEIFALDETKNLKPVTLFLDVKAVYKIVSKKFIKLVKVTDSKQSPSNLIYTSVVIQLLDVLTILTQFTSSANLDVKRNLNIKKNFWQIGKAKSNTRLNEYIKLGPCNSAPIYYKYLSGFLLALKNSGVRPEEDFDFLDFSNVKDAHKLIDRYFLPQFSNFIGPDSLKFKNEATQCFIHVYNLFNEQVDLSHEGINYNLFLTILDSISSSRVSPSDEGSAKACLESLADFAKTRALETEAISEKLVRNKDTKIEGEGYTVHFKSAKDKLIISYYLVLTSVSETASGELLLAIFETLADTYEADTLTVLTRCLVRMLQLSKVGTSKIVDWTLESLPSYITSDFVDVPILLIESVIKCSNSKDLKDFCSDCFTKISSESPLRLPKFLSIVFEQNVFEARSVEEVEPEIYGYLVSLAEKVEKLDAENDLILHLVDNPHILGSVLASEPGNLGRRKILNKLVSRGEVPNGEAVSELVKFAASSCDDTCKAFLNLIQDRRMVQNALFDTITSSLVGTSFSNLASYVQESENDVLFSEIQKELETACEHVDIYSLAIANPLEQNIYLISQPGAVTLSPQIMPIASFLGEFLKISEPKDVKHLIWFAKALEYSEDFEFLSEIGTDHESLNSLRDSFNADLFSKPIDGCALKEIFDSKSEVGFYGNLAAHLRGRGPFTPDQFYSAKVLIRFLSEAFESMSLANFDKLDIQYTKLAGNPLMLATFLCCALKFVGHSSKLDRLRNYVFGEILGIQSAPGIVQSGITWVALATNFFNNVSYEVLPSHKMAMVVNQISGWLNSEVAYDEAFDNMRVLLSQFFAQLISSTSDEIPDKIWELSSSLCLNNFSTAQVKPNFQALKYFTLKLFVVLSKHVDQSVYPQWIEDKASLYEEIFEFLHQEQGGMNQPIHLVNDLLERILTQADLPEKLLADQASMLYDILSSSKLENLQRIAASLLRKRIYELQQDVIVEYQLRKPNDEEDDLGEVDELVKLPESLLRDIRDLEHHLDDYVLHSKFAAAFKYLWSWLLIFAFLEDSTISMKSAYIEQIKKNDAINKLLGTIFDCINLTDSKFLNSLVISPIEKNTKVVSQNCLIQEYQISKGRSGNSPKDEVLFLLCHLYYLSLRFLGAFAQQWFQDLRDLQLKQQVQRFSVNYISPVIISKMLDDVDKTKDKLTKGDENFNIKVNRVTNEIKSSYVIDEQNMEMVVKIPEAFPLLKVSVEGPLRLGVKEKQWKAWLMASQRVISLTNGSITDCIELFNKNVNLHFSGFTECAICYSILHQDHSLPSKVCPTCLNKFHSGCLYKWFKSSGSSTCPLCRSTFNFRATRA